MNPSDDDQQRDDLSDNLFPEANQRLTSHDFYSQRPATTDEHNTYREPHPQYDEVAQSPALDDVEENTYEAETGEYCPECDAPLVLKEGTLSNYIACSRFPDCKFTKPYEGEDVQERTSAKVQGEQEEWADDNTNNKYEENASDQYDSNPYSQNNSNYYSRHADNPRSEDNDSDYEERTASSDETYDEPSRSDEQHYEEGATDPESYSVEYGDTQASEVDEPSHDNFQPSIYGRQKDAPEVAHAPQDPIEQTQPAKNRSDLLNHPVFLDKKEAAESKKWAEMKQKRLTDQKIMAGVSPLAPGEEMPDPAELEETLKKLESNVAQLQQNDQRLPSQSSQPNPHRAQLNNGDEDNFYSD